MIRFDCLKLLAPRITDQLVVTSLSGQKIEWASLSQHPGNLLVGTMGTALGVGIGLAIGLPQRKVIVLESDGSMLLSLFNLATLANLDPKNLVVLVFDNQVYSGTRISEPTATAGKTDLTMMARGAGIEQAVTVRDLAAFEQEMEAATVGLFKPQGVPDWTHLISFDQDDAYGDEALQVLLKRAEDVARQTAQPGIVEEVARLRKVAAERTTKA